MPVSLLAPHQWTEDTREPVFEFRLYDQVYGLYLVSFPIMIGVFLLILGVAFLAGLTSIPLYYTVVRKPNSLMAGLTGFCLYLPFWILAPQKIADACQIRNKLFLFCCCVVTPTVSIFRVTEAIFGFTPPYARKSASSFALYFGCPLVFAYDTKRQVFVKSTWSKQVRHLQLFFAYLVFTGIFHSLFRLSHLFPPLGESTPDDWYDWKNVMNPNMWITSLTYGTLFQLYLTTFGEGLIFAISLLTQREVVPLMDNPIFESKSPSDFWGRRWNTIVHHCLKNGIYKPVRLLGGTREMAVVVTFLASAAFHEWILPVVFFDQMENVRFGTTTVFFVWQAFLICLEYAFVNNLGTWKQMYVSVPAPLRTAFVILLGLPLGHWFCDPYVHSTFFSHSHMMLIAILPAS